MRSRKLITILVIVGVVIALGYSTLDFSGFLTRTQTPKAQTTTVTVAEVLDGDTIKLANGKRVRLLGIDAPEKGYHFYEESKNRLEQLIEEKKVLLESDVSNIDRYDRLLRYVFTDGTFVNLEMVREGYASVYIISPDVKYSDKLMEAEREARERGVGIWRSTNLSYVDCLEITNFHYNAKGKDNENLNDEYVIFRNNCDFSVNMTGWAVKDAYINIYKFPKFGLADKATMTLYSGSGRDTASELYWNSNKPIWNNNGDTLYMRDVDGNLILTKSYK